MMAEEEWVRDLAITLRVLETSYPYNVFPIAKIVGQARALGLSLRKNKYVVRAVESNRVLFTFRRVSRYTFFGLSREGRAYADTLLNTILTPTQMASINSIPVRVRLSIVYDFQAVNMVCKRVHNILVDVAFMKEGEPTKPIEADDVYGVIKVIDRGFEYEVINLHNVPPQKTPILNKYPIIRSMFKYVLTNPGEAYRVDQELARTLLYTLALRPQLMNIETSREYDTIIIRWGEKRICCECVDPETCIHV